MTALQGESQASVDEPSHPAAFLEPDPDASAVARDVASNGNGSGKPRLPGSLTGEQSGKQ